MFKDLGIDKNEAQKLLKDNDKSSNIDSNSRLTTLNKSKVNKQNNVKEILKEKPKEFQRSKQNKPQKPKETQKVAKELNPINPDKINLNDLLNNHINNEMNDNNISDELELESQNTIDITSDMDDGVVKNNIINMNKIHPEEKNKLLLQKDISDPNKN